MLLHIVILIGSIYAILKASDLFVDLASSLGRQLKLKDYFIGSLIVGVGTSLPELFTSIAAVGEQEPALVAPNIFGTVVANLGAGFGLAVLVLYVWVPVGGQVRIFTKKHARLGGTLTFGAEGPGNHYIVPVILASVSVVLSWAVCRDGLFDRRDAGLFLVGYAVFLLFEFNRRNKPGPSNVSGASRASPQAVQKRTRAGLAWLRTLGPPLGVLLLFVVCLLGDQGDHLLHGPITEGLFLLGLVVIAGVQAWLFFRWRGRESRVDFGSFPAILLRRRPKWLLILLLTTTILVVYFAGVVAVKAILGLAEDLNLATGVLAASALAVGTSLPDIVVALNVARRGRHRLLVGHIIQSNVFDVFLIMAVCGFVTPLPEMWTGPSRTSILFAIALTLPLLIIIRTRKINFWGGLGLFTGFIVFLVLLYG